MPKNEKHKNMNYKMQFKRLKMSKGNKYKQKVIKSKIDSKKSL